MRKTLIASALAAPMVLANADAQATVRYEPSGVSQAGLASFYHDRFHGRRTASGTRYDKNELSAAHKTLPLGTQVRVTDPRSGHSVVVMINDRGPFVRGRVIDLSRAAAREIGLTHKGVSVVEVQVLKQQSHLTLDEIF